MNIIERKSASRQGTNVTMNPKGGKFVGAMRKLAKKRSESRSVNPLQVGNVLTKKAPMKGAGKFTSGEAHGDDKGLKVQSTEGQTALDPKQQGASSKNMQRGSGSST